MIHQTSKLDFWNKFKIEREISHVHLLIINHLKSHMCFLNFSVVTNHGVRFLSFSSPRGCHVWNTWDEDEWIFNVVSCESGPAREWYCQPWRLPWLVIGESLWLTKLVVFSRWQRAQKCAIIQPAWMVHRHVRYGRRKASIGIGHAKS